MPNGTPAIGELEAFVRLRAAQGPRFRDALLADPREAISRELGIELPGTARIIAIETAPGQIALVLPPGVEALHDRLLAQGPAGDDCDCCCC